MKFKKYIITKSKKRKKRKYYPYCFCRNYYSKYKSNDLKSFSYGSGDAYFPTISGSISDSSSLE
jgi:hypothetical protein